MKDIIPKDTRYVPLVQQKSCCVAASISIVMNKLGIPLISQELLGYHLGLTIADEFKYLFWSPRTGEKPPAGYGCRVVPMEKYNPNAEFKKLGIPLEMTIHHIDEFKVKDEFVEFVQKFTKQNEDILVAFHNGVLSGVEDKGGHICVMDRIYPDRNIIRLIDPSPTQPKWREVDVDILIKAMKAHPSNNGGFWELNKTR
jgi:hypothetical protein